MKRHSLMVATGCLLLAGCSLVGARTTPEPAYKVLAQDGKFEVRQYKPLVIAETVVEAEYKESGNIGFRRLGGYIFGKNKQEEKIAMTAPVLQKAHEDKWTMTFVMPDKFTLDSLPDPIDPNVQLKTSPARKVATYRYSGTMSAENINANAAKLEAWMKENGYKAISSPSSAAYDPPWTLPMMRRNEVHIDVE